MSIRHKALHLVNILRLPAEPTLKPLSINVEINNTCNLNCVMCHRESIQGLERRIDLAEFAEIYRQIRSPYVALHGYGEPLLNRDLTAIIKNLKQSGAKVSITSNMAALKPEMIQPLIRSGLGLLKISLDSHNRETYKKIRGADALDKVVDNIIRFEQAVHESETANTVIRISYTIQPANYLELNDFVKFARHKLNQKTVFFQLLLFRNTLLAETDLGQMDKQAFRNSLIEAEQTARRVGLRSNLPEILAQFEESWSHYIIGYDGQVRGAKCLKPWLTTFIGANGEVRPCDLLGLTDVVMGNVFEQPFSEIWRSPAYTEFRRGIAAGDRPTSICRECRPPSLIQWLKYQTFTPNYLKE